MIEIQARRGITAIKPLIPLLRDYGLMILGGYARYCLSPHRRPVEATDIDLFPVKGDTHDAVGGLLAVGCEVTFRSDVSTSLQPPRRWSHLPKIQVINPTAKGRILTVGTPAEILNNFDFTVVRAGLLLEHDCEVGLVDDDFLNDEAALQLVLKNIHCPVSSLLRCIKYAARGYKLQMSEAFKLFQDWDSRDASYREQLYKLMENYKPVAHLPQEVDNETGLLLPARDPMTEADRQLLYEMMFVD